MKMDTVVPLDEKVKRVCFLFWSFEVLYGCFRKVKDESSLIRCLEAKNRGKGNS